MPQLQLWFKYAPSGPPALILLACSGIEKDLGQHTLPNIKTRGSKGETAAYEDLIPKVVQGFVHQPFEEIGTQRFAQAVSPCMSVSTPSCQSCIRP